MDPNPFSLVVSRATASLLRGLDDLDDISRVSKLLSASQLMHSTAEYLLALAKELHNPDVGGDDPLPLPDEPPELPGREDDPADLVAGRESLIRERVTGEEVLVGTTITTAQWIGEGPP